MFCPTCGTESHFPEQRFCKTCGTNIAVLSQMLRNPAPAFTEAPTIPAGQPKQRVVAAMPQVSPQALTAAMEVLGRREDNTRSMLRKIGWGMLLGGPMMIPSIAIIGAITNTFPEFCVFGIPVTLAGVFLLLFTRFAMKRPEMPQVIIVQQNELAAAPVALPQAPATPLPIGHSNYLNQPRSVTEDTTGRLAYQPVNYAR
jgi:hypothetical protein